MPRNDGRDTLSSLVPHNRRKVGRPKVDHVPAVIAREFGLTAKQRAFAEAYVTLGGKSGVGCAAARAAGYSPTDLRRASKLLKHPGVLEYIKHLSRQRLSAGAALGAETLLAIAENGRPTDAVKLKAATALLAHGGLAPVVQTENRTVVEHRGGMSSEALAHSISTLRAFLGYPEEPPVIDVTPVPEAQS
jgi:hypothetical protein